ncbi:molybdopterin-binding protein [Microvirga terricola]|uniref:Molybdopterin-dependent oxidoreductase n=1 Tax=Microvirga terricola TaxID=2719797 RepID=A0ABX0VDB9_9HYPH|nr:molybdopterin-binding protein [Microvirga terricola]NIX76351.1 molybdopterin-dependent oxidoreductase [Microvirga terricola]
MSGLFSRRRFLGLSTIGASAMFLSGCDRLAQNEKVRNVLDMAETLTKTTQRALLSQGALAREYPEADISPVFKVNGTSMPDGEEYARLLEGGFADWRLVVDGLVRQPLSLSLADLKNLPSRTQVTRHDCVEGWSAIGKWTGVPLSVVLEKVGLLPSARYVVFHCADDLGQTLGGSGRYYESLDLVDAFHPQTILAYGMNGEDLPVAHGAPLRLRVERQLGYKHAKYLLRVQATDSFAGIEGGKGGFWEDFGYEWYAGI